MALLMRWLHIGGVIVGVGSTVFVRLILMPVLSTLDPATASTVAAAVVRRAAPVTHTAILAILVSGTYNFFMLNPQPTPDRLALYHSLFGLKVLFALVIFTIAILATSRKPRPFVQRHRPTMLLTSLVLAGIIIAFSAYLRSLR